MEPTGLEPVTFWLPVKRFLFEAKYLHPFGLAFRKLDGHSAAFFISLDKL